MHNKYHYRLNLPIHFSVEDTDSRANYAYYDKHFPELEQLLLLDGVAIRECVRIYIEPGSGLWPHRDCDHENNYTKLNFVYGGQNSVMKWFKLKPGSELIQKLTESNSKYSAVSSLDDITEVYQTTVGFPSLVNVGCIHGVRNGTTEPRICYSFVLVYAENPTRNLDWDDAVERLKNFIVVDQP